MFSKNFCKIFWIMFLKARLSTMYLFKLLKKNTTVCICHLDEGETFTWMWKVILLFLIHKKNSDRVSDYFLICFHHFTTKLRRLFYFWHSLEQEPKKQGIRTKIILINLSIKSLDIHDLEAVPRRHSSKKVAWNFIKKETLAQVFHCEFCEMSKNTFSYRTPPVASSDGSIFWQSIEQTFSGKSVSFIFGIIDKTWTVCDVF